MDGASPSNYTDMARRRVTPAISARSIITMYDAILYSSW
jgi:hypothetical protein